VGAGDTDGDGLAEVITGPGHGSPQVNVYDGLTGALRSSFLAYDKSFKGGVFVTAGDVNGDGKAEIITGAGFGGGPHVRVFDPTGTVVGANFFAFASSFAGGVRVAARDTNNDGMAEIVVGKGPTGDPLVGIFDGLTGVATKTFEAFDPNFNGGIYVG
jgi:hypothetical protein